MSTIPDSIIDIIYQYVHQLQLLNSLKLIKYIGISTCEDLPDLIDTRSIFLQTDNNNDERGFSERVTEFVRKVNHVPMC